MLLPGNKTFIQLVKAKGGGNCRQHTGNECEHAEHRPHLVDVGYKIHMSLLLVQGGIPSDYMVPFCSDIQCNFVLRQDKRALYERSVLLRYSTGIKLSLNAAGGQKSLNAC